MVKRRHMILVGPVLLVVGSKVPERQQALRLLALGAGGVLTVLGLVDGYFKEGA